MAKRAADPVNDGLDPTQYHNIQDSTIKGTRIPKASRYEDDGRSPAFDPNKPTKVIVYPAAIGSESAQPGFEVDFSEFIKHKEQFNLASSMFEDRKDTVEFFRDVKDKMEPPKEEVSIEKTASALEHLMEEEKEKAQGLVNKVKRFNPDEWAANNPRSFNAEDATYEDFIKRQQASPAVPINIPFLQSPTPLKPKIDVFFDLGEMGTLVAKYHSVVLGKDCLSLIYDTRFEDGFQYLPPVINKDVKIRLDIPKLSKEESGGKTSFLCSSHGLHWTLGCLDVVVLLTHKDETNDGKKWSN